MTVADFLSCFAAEINELADQNLLSWDSLLDGRWNGNSWLHARMFGAMVRAVRRPAFPMVEVKWNGGFVPDLCLVDGRDKVIGVVEYESTNSSDERLVGKDLEHFEAAVLEYQNVVADLPGWWLVISTLPRCPVRRWPWYADKKVIGWNICTDYPPAVKSRESRNANPLAYYEDGLHTAFAESVSRIATAFGGSCPTTVIWANIDGNALSVMNVNGERAAEAQVHPLRLNR
jgi:hypothetical protein